MGSIKIFNLHLQAQIRPVFSFNRVIATIFQSQLYISLAVQNSNQVAQPAASRNIPEPLYPSEFSFNDILGLLL